MDDTQLEKLLVSIGERRVEHKQSAFERHAQTALTLLAVTILAGFGAFLFKISDVQNAQLAEIKVMQYQVTQLTESIKTMSSSYVSQIEFISYKKNMEVRVLHLEQSLPR